MASLLPPLVDDPVGLRDYRDLAYTYSTPRRFVQRAKSLIEQAVTSGGLGLDGSFWQSSIDALVAKAAGIYYGIFRALYGTSPDTKFPQHWNAFKGVMPRTAYLYYLDGQDAIAQADKLFQTIPANDREEITVVIDIEGYNNPKLTIGKIKLCCERLTYLFGKKPIIYTGYYVWKAIAGDKNWAVSYPLWIAAYPLTGWADDYPTKVLNYQPLIPAPWQMWTANENEPLEGRACLWQWTSSAPADDFGSTGFYLDLNHCSPAFAKVYGIGETLPPPVPLGELQMQFKALKTYNIRSGPGTQYPDIGDLTIGTIITAQKIQTVSPSSVWVEFEPGKWAAMVHAGVEYLDFHAAVPCPEGEPSMTPEQLTRLENAEATIAQHDLEITTLQNTFQADLFIATHRVVTLKPT